MSSTSQLTTFQDLYTDLLQRVRVSTSITATVEQAKRYINIALHDIHLGTEYKLPWCERQDILRTKAPITIGTVSATQGSAILNFTGSPSWATPNVFGQANGVPHGKIIIEGDSTPYRIGSVDSDFQMTMDARWTNASVTNVTYTYFEDAYFLISTFLRPIDFQSFSPAAGIQLISRTEFRRKYPVVNVSGKPKVACLIDDSLTNSIAQNTRKVVFYPYPDQTYIIPYTYISNILAYTSAGAGITSMSADTDVPIIPLRYRHVIIFHALSHWYRDRKDDGRATAAKGEYNDIMVRIMNDQDIATHTKAQIQPGNARYAQYARSPYQNRGGRKVFDLNDEFDSFRR